MGPETSDDAGVYRIGPSCALVETSDIITPLVDDPFSFGRIAAANAVSDVYAMGARPVTAMNLVFFPACSVPGEALREILAGGQSVLRVRAVKQAQAVLVRTPQSLAEQQLVLVFYQAVTITLQVVAEQVQV